MTDTPDNEIKLLRQAIARLSDRIEHLENKIVRLERGQKPAEAQAAPPQKEKPPEFWGMARDKKEPEPAPRPEIAKPAVPAQEPPIIKVRPPKEEQRAVPPAATPAQPPAPPAIPPASWVKPPAETVPPPLLEKPVIQVPPPILPKPPIGQVPPPILPELRPARAEGRPAAPQDRDIAALLADKKPATPAAEQPQPEAAGKDKPRRDIELNIGKYWLNKIGIGVFVLGVGFLVAYSSRYFGNLGPWPKILIGYLVAAALFFIGRRLERTERTTNFGYVLTGGAWALAYFTTFAMQHFPQSRVLESEGLDLILLGIVAAGMLVHSLKYRSEALSGVAIFAGYATATIGDVRYFTLLSCAIESIVILVLVYKFKWLRMMFMGILMTYGAHFLWVTRNIHAVADGAAAMTAKSFFLMNGTFLTLYLAVFTAGIHLLRKTGDEELENKLAVANIGNALFYFLLTYPDVTKFFPDQRFGFVVSLGAAFLILGSLLYSSGGGKLFACDTLMGIALITAAVPIKYMPTSTALVWIAELPFLFYAGLALKSRTVRVASYLLFIWTMLYYKLYVAGGAGSFDIEGLGSVPIAGVTAFAAALSFGGVFTMLRRAVGSGGVNAWENSFAQAFPPAAALFLCIGTVVSANPANLTLYLFLDALLLFGWGYAAGEAAPRVCATLFLGWGFLRFIGVDDYGVFTPFRRWSYIAWEVLCSYSVYFLYRDLRERNLLRGAENFLVTAVAAASGLLVLTAVLRYVPEDWVTFTIAGLSAATFAVAYLSDSRSLRVSALAGSALVMGRFLLLDRFASASVADWLIIIFPPLAQAVIYFLYRDLRADGKLPEAERGFPDAAYALFQITLMTLLFRYLEGWKMTAAFAMMNLVLFGAGWALREKVVRCAALAAMPVVLARFIAVDDYPAGQRLLPLFFTLGSAWALAYSYAQALKDGTLETDERPLSGLVTGYAAFLSAVAVWRYAPENWVASIFALAGLAVFLYGYFLDSRNMRVAGSAFLFASLVRAVFWDDYSSLGLRLRWLPVAIETLSFAAAFWFYRAMRLAGRLSGMEAGLSQWLFAGLSTLACVSIMRYCPPFWASSTLAVFAAAVFFGGSVLGEPAMRLCSAALFAPVLGRSWYASEPYMDLGAMRWLPISVQLVSMFGVYMYYRYSAGKGEVRGSEAAVPPVFYGGFILLLLSLIALYAGDTARPLIFTGCCLFLFGCGALYGDALPRGSWITLVPAVFLAYANNLPVFSSLIYSALYAAVLSAGIYFVYAVSAYTMKERLSDAERKLLPALCFAGAVTTILSVSHYAPELLKTPAAAACLLALYIAGSAMRDDVLAVSGFLFAPYILVRRLDYDTYAGTAFLVKWSAALSAPAAFLGVYLTGLKSPGRVFKDGGAAFSAWAGLIPCALFLLHAIFYYSTPSLITLALGVAGLAFFVPGFRYRDKTLRYAGLIMFAAAVLRIGVVDIAGLSILYKIISFILLGLILLGVSFFYTRFMVDDPEEPGKGE